MTVVAAQPLQRHGSVALDDELVDVALDGGDVEDLADRSAGERLDHGLASLERAETHTRRRCPFGVLGEHGVDAGGVVRGAGVEEALDEGAGGFGIHRPVVAGPRLAVRRNARSG